MVLLKPMLRFLSRYRLLAPLLALAAAAVVLARCDGGDAGSGSAAKEADPEAKDAAEPPVDVDAWADSFARQVPPPAELRRDGALESGTLANGLRYLVMEQPSGDGVSFRLLVLAGSMHETEEEQGFAHFVEHMAFRGTLHHPAGDALAMFERLGLKAGAHANAFTRPDCTVWKLDAPLPDETSLTTALQYLRDVADGILFREDEVTAEREVILRELDERYGKGDAARQRVAAILPAVPAAHRMPMGTRAALERATAAPLRAFWQRYYVPSRMVLVATGDLETRAMVARLRSHFDSLPARESPPDPPTGDPLAGGGADIACLTNPAATTDDVRISLAAPQPVQPITDDPARRRTVLVRRVMLRMLLDHLDRLSAKIRAGAVWREADHVEWTPQLGWLQVASGLTRADDVKPAVTFLAREWLRGRDRGFAEVEFEAARQHVRGELRREFAARVAGGAADAADALVQSVRTATVFESPEDELNRARTTLDSLTKAECEARCREDWSRGVLTLIIEGKNVKHLADEAQGIVNEEWGKKPAAPEKYPAPRALEITAPGPRGKVIRRTLDSARGLLEAELSNGVRVWLKPLPGLGGSISVRVLGGHGALSVPLDQPGLRVAAELLVYWNPLGGWRVTEFEAALAAHDAGWDFDVEDDTFQWHAGTSRLQLARQLEVFCACLHTPGLETASPWNPGERDLAWLRTIAANKATGREVRRAIAGDDPRLDPAPPDFANTNNTRTAAWLLPILKNCRVGVVIAGDFAPDAALEALTRTFGALPPREPWDAPCPWPPLPAPEPRVLRTNAKATTASASLLLPFRYLNTTEEATNAGLLEHLTSLRLRAIFRQQTSTSYSPEARFWSAPDKSRDWLIWTVRCETARLDETAGRLRTLLEELQTTGWTSDEFQRAARPYGPWLRRHLRNPDLWTFFPVHPPGFPSFAALNTEALLQRQAAVKKLTEEVLNPAAAAEVRIRPAAE